MSAIWLVFCLLILTIQIVLGDIKDFIVKREADHQRFGHSNDIAFNDESLYYDDEDSELDMYDNCGGGGAGVYDAEQVTLEDYMMMGDNNRIMDDYFKDGKIKLELLHKLISKLAKNQKNAQLLEQAGYDDGYGLEIPNSCAAQDQYSLEII